MVFIENLSFVYIVAFVLVFNAAKSLIKDKEILSFLLFCGSILIIHVLTKIQSILLIVGISFLVYSIGYYLNKNLNHKKVLLFTTISTLAGFFIIRNYQLTNLSVIDRVGLSYILFRLIHFLVDSSKGKINDFNLLAFFNYIIFFPTFLAGPIDRYNNFSYWLKNERNGYQPVLIKAGIFRLGLGIIKKYLIVPPLSIYALDFSHFSNVSWQEGLLISLAAYSFYILLDFSGYTDIAIGTAYLIGIRIPENFNWPYLSKNISVFWKRWHMTFSNFLFEYLFKPIVTQLSKNYQKAPRLLITVIGYTITFVICGLWHGSSINFVFWGLWHSFGLIVYRFWVYLKGANLITPANKIIRGVFNFLSVVITFSFVTTGWFFFKYSTEEISVITKNFFSSSEKLMSINLIQDQTRDGLRIDFKNPDIRDSLIDIEITGLSDKVQNNFYLQRTNDNGAYFFIPEKQQAQIYLIKIRSQSKIHSGKWISQVVYFNNRKSNGDIRYEQNLNEKNTLFENRMNLPLRLATQQLVVKPNFFDGYGWGMKMHYMPDFLSSVDIEYRNENSSEWIPYQINRAGEYDFCDIHGNVLFNETSRNLPPGKYLIRIRYTNGMKKSTWFEAKATIPDYTDEKH